MDVEVVAGGVKHTVEELYEREQECWAYWKSLDRDRKEHLVRTVQTEMERLATTVSNWLPASAKRNNGFIDVLIRLQVDEKGDPTPTARTAEDRLEEALAINSLKEILEEDDE